MKSKLPLALFSLRIGVFIVFFMWALDKLVNPEHAASVFERYYKIEGLASTAAYVIGGIQMILLFAFLGGLWKKWTYGALLIFHTVSTASTWNKLVDPWTAPNLLFYTSLPMLAAIFALWLMRHEDTLLTVGRK